MIVLLIFVALVNARPPIVLMHGIGADAPNMDTVKGWISKDFPGTYVLSVSVGAGKPEVHASWTLDMNVQVANFAAVVKNDSVLASAPWVDVIGYSQGGLIVRGYVERYTHLESYPRVRNMITWCGPHLGVYGVPEFNYYCPNKSPECDILNDAFSLLLKDPLIAGDLQHHISFAGFWRDPFAEAAYLRVNEFLADINNERSMNTTYRENMLALNQTMFIWSTNDHIIIPQTSSIWASYAWGTDKVVVPFNASEQYTKDLLGLATLAQRGAFNTGTIPCLHQNVNGNSCKPYVWPLTTKYLQ